MITILFVTLILLALLEVPIGFAIGLSAAAALAFGSGPVQVPQTIIIQRMFAQADSFPLMAIPFFVLAGGLMDRGGISRKLIDFATALVGWIRGGLAMVSVLAAMFFAGISGSAAADTAAIGSVLIPAMREKGYKKAFAASVQATAGSIGVIVPPSIPMVVYALVGDVSVGRLFFAGYLPGLLVALGLMAVSYYFAVKEGYPTEPWQGARALWRSFADSIWALGLAVVIMGGILSGIFTATEASVVAVVYSLAVGRWIYKDLKWRDIPEILVQTGVTTAVVMFTVATSAALGWVLTRQQVPMHITQWMVGLSDSPIVIFLLINVILLVVGTFLDTTPAIILLAPILVPIARQFGIDPLHLGMVTVFNLAIGMSTPPVGICLFVSCGIAEVTVSKLLRSLLPYLAVMLAVLLLLTYVPAISLWLPNLLMGQ